MYIATVVPIKKGMQKEYLTYFSAANIPLGSIVTVPVRKKTIEAIVVGIENAEDLKSDIKNADFEIKKIIEVKGNSPFTREFFIACERMKDYCTSSTGAIIQAMLPNTFLENVPLLQIPIQSGITATNENMGEHAKENKRENIKHEKLIFQALTPDRAAFYRTLIREAFAKKQSVYLCVPTRFDIEEWKESLRKGIEQYVFSFHSDMAKKSLIDNYNNALEISHPILIIGTGMFLSIPRADIKTIILEHESSDAYKQIARPFIDIRNFVEVMTSISKERLIFGDTILRPDTLYRHEQGEFGEVSPPLFRLAESSSIVIDMNDKKGNIKNTPSDKKFLVLSERTKLLIEGAVKNEESVFLFTVRKGLAGITVCNDCGTSVLCPNCGTPIVLYGAKQRNATKIATNRIFMCNKCGHKESTEMRCQNCQSWNLNPLGIGTDRVHEEVRSLFPKSVIFQLDKETAPTHKEAQRIITDFYKTPGSILIGTEMAFSYMHISVKHSALVSLDGLLSIPSFNITQKILHIIEKLHHITEGSVIIQTRMAEHQILRYILSGNVLPLYREDLKERKVFGYPPFKRLIKIAFTGSAKDTEHARSYLESNLSTYEPQIFSAFIGRVRGEYVTNTVIKVEPKEWPLPLGEAITSSPILRDILSRLPPSFSINVDPEDLL